MPKKKTNKSVAKRVKITANGKARRRSPGSGHLKSVKSSKRLRNLRKDRDIAPAIAKQAKRMLGR